MSQIQTTDKANAIELVLVGGDLSKLTAEQRVSHYNNVCASLDLNPLTRPFEYITLNGKLQLYARKDCTDQLRAKRSVSIEISKRERIDDVYVVTARATLPTGRQDESTGAVTIGSAKGDSLANALMKAETKAKRRVTLSICGLGILDESELETISRDPVPAVRPVQSRSPNVSASREHDESKALPAPVDHKARFSAAVQAFAQVNGVDLAAARNDAARRFGHKGASGLTDDEYAGMADAIDGAIVAGMEWTEWVAEKQAV